MFGLLELFDSQDLIDALLIMFIGAAPADGFLSDLLGGLLGELLYGFLSIPNGADLFGQLGDLGGSF